MTLGTQIKLLRHERSLSQPELAELAGIEQSYLSKLENDKSMPSNDIFRQLLTALNIDLESFLALFDRQTIELKLKQITDIEQWLSKQTQQTFSLRRNYLLISSVLIVLAVTLFYIGFSKVLFTETKYTYRSEGIIFAGEPKDVYENWSRLLSKTGDNQRKVREQKRLEMEKRVDVDMLVMDHWMGEYISVPTPNGHRHYRSYKEKNVVEPINAWLQVFGVFLLTCGTMGFVLEKKLYR